MDAAKHRPAGVPDVAGGPLCPLSLTVDPLARMLNVEFADDPHYDGLELQWFDDEVHGTGMLAFLSRRADRRVDYYPQRGLRLDPAGYQIGGGTGSWTETDFAAATLEVADDGVRARVRFTDVDGRLVELDIDDRDGRRRRRAHLLAPVGAGIDRPAALLLVWLRGFDLVRVTGTTPSIRIGGRPATTGRLPGARLHRRHLIKYAAPVCAVQLNRTLDGPLAGPEGHLELTPDRTRIAAVTAEQGGHFARVELDPALPDVRILGDGAAEEGDWHITVDDVRLTGGTWTASRAGDVVRLGLDVTRRWRPGRQPWLIRLVTTVMPVFRRWPTTYRWRADLQLGPSPTMSSRWQRTVSDSGQAYRRATRS
jgi:hypothetical protein